MPDVVACALDRTEATRVVVFGAIDWGDDGSDSDIDLVVVRPVVTRRHDDGVRDSRALRDLSVPVCVLIVDEAELDREAKQPGVIRVAVREGWIIDRPAAAPAR